MKDKKLLIPTILIVTKRLNISKTRKYRLPLNMLIVKKTKHSMSMHLQNEVNKFKLTNMFIFDEKTVEAK